MSNHKSHQTTSATTSAQTQDMQPAHEFVQPRLSRGRPLTSSGTSIIASSSTVIVRAPTLGTSIRIPYDVEREAIRRANLRANGLSREIPPATDDSL
jgi:hypothetical protein